jgi:hypothetical protein
MQINKRSMVIILISTAIALALLVGGAALVKNARVDRPVSMFLAANPDVLEYRIEAGNTETLISIELAPVANVQESYETLEAQIREIMKDRPYRIVLKDNRNQRLDAAYYELHFSLREAAATGHFVTMAEEMRSRCEDLQLTDVRVYVGEENLYLDARDGEHYLYAVMPRQDAAVLKRGEKA